MLRAVRRAVLRAVQEMLIVASVWMLASISA
jgi:hypothetical protein